MIFDLNFELLIDGQILFALKLELLGRYDFLFFLVHYFLHVFEFANHLFNDPLICSLFNHNCIYFSSVLEFQIIYKLLELLMFECYCVFILVHILLFSLIFLIHFDVIKDVHFFDITNHNSLVHHICCLIAFGVIDLFVLAFVLF